MRAKRSGAHTSVLRVAVVGSTPTGATGSPSRALMKLDLPALNSPTTATRSGRSRSTAIASTSERASSSTSRPATSASSASSGRKAPSPPTSFGTRSPELGRPARGAPCRRSRGPTAPAWVPARRAPRPGSTSAGFELVAAIARHFERSRRAAASRMFESVLQVAREDGGIGALTSGVSERSQGFVMAAFRGRQSRSPARIAGKPEIDDELSQAPGGFRVLAPPDFARDDLRALRVRRAAAPARAPCSPAASESSARSRPRSSQPRPSSSAGLRKRTTRFASPLAFPRSRAKPRSGETAFRPELAIRG